MVSSLCALFWLEGNCAAPSDFLCATQTQTTIPIEKGTTSTILPTAPATKCLSQLGVNGNGNVYVAAGFNVVTITANIVRTTALKLGP